MLQDVTLLPEEHSNSIITKSLCNSNLKKMKTKNIKEIPFKIIK